MALAQPAAAEPSGNNADTSGGGIYANENVTTISNSTIAGNGADEGGGLFDVWGELHMLNTIVADSTSGGDCVSLNGLGTNTTNLVEDGGCDALEANQVFDTVGHPINASLLGSFLAGLNYTTYLPLVQR
jgi:predicted outer membrane repeat protein